MAEVSKIGHLKVIREVTVVMHGWQSKSMDGPKGGWSVGLSIHPSNLILSSLVWSNLFFPSNLIKSYLNLI